MSVAYEIYDEVDDCVDPNMWQRLIDFLSELPQMPDEIRDRFDLDLEPLY